MAPPPWAYARPSQRPRRRAALTEDSGRRRPLRDRPGSQKAVHQHGSDAGSYDRNSRRTPGGRHGSGRRRGPDGHTPGIWKADHAYRRSRPVVGLASAGAEATRSSVSIKQVSVTPLGGDPAGASVQAVVSPDGRYVAFSSYAGDLVPGDGTTSWLDVFVRDTWTGSTVRVSGRHGRGGPERGQRSGAVQRRRRVSGTSTSSATDLIQGTGTRKQDVFVRDLVAGTTVRASVDLDGGDPNGDSFVGSISADGRFVAFWSFASDLIRGDGRVPFSDVFVRDLVAETASGSRSVPRARTDRRQRRALDGALTVGTWRSSPTPTTWSRRTGTALGTCSCVTW